MLYLKKTTTKQQQQQQQNPQYSFNRCDLLHDHIIDVGLAPSEDLKGQFFLI